MYLHMSGAKVQVKFQGPVISCQLSVVSGLPGWSVRNIPGSKCQG